MPSSSKVDLLHKVRFQNPLPPPPFPPKLLNIPTNPKRYAVAEFTASLANETLLPMVVDAELGMPLDLSFYDCIWDEDADDKGAYYGFLCFSPASRTYFLWQNLTRTRMTSLLLIQKMRSCSEMQQHYLLQMVIRREPLRLRKFRGCGRPSIFQVRLVIGHRQTHMNRT